MGRNFFLIFFARRVLKPSYFLVGLGLLAIFFYGQLFKLPDGRLHVRFLDVGQGDAILVTTDKNQKILIDGGPGSRLAKPLSRYFSFNDSVIDLVVLTHPHADHLGGILYVLNKFKVKNLVFQANDYDTRGFANFLKLAEKQRLQGAKVLAVQNGDVLSLGPVRLKVFWPPQKDYFVSKTNNQSIVLLLSYGDFDVFLPGEQEIDEAKKMISQVTLTPVEVLKVSHHGSKNGLDDNLLNLLKPDLAVISVGKGNSYGHPHSEPLELLSKYTINVLRTDLNGTIDVMSDGQRWSARSER